MLLKCFEWFGSPIWRSAAYLIQEQFSYQSWFNIPQGLNGNEIDNAYRHLRTVQMDQKVNISCWSFRAPFSSLFNISFLWDSLRLQAFFLQFLSNKKYQAAIFLMVTDLKKVGEFLAASGMVFCTFPKVEVNQQIKVAECRVEKKSPKSEGDLQPF